MSIVVRPFVLILFLLGCFVSPGTLQAAERLVAKVGTVPLTNFELQREINQIMPMKVSFHGRMSPEKQQQIQDEALERLIERGYKVCYAFSKQMMVAPERVTAVVDEVKGKFATEKDFEQAVAEETLPGLRASIYRTLLAQDAEKAVVESQLMVSDKDVRDYYEEHKESYFRPKQFRASHIMVKVDPALRSEEKEALQQKASSLLERLRKGEDFYQLAYYNSDDRTKFVGGDLGFFHAGQTVPEFETALMQMQVGEISELVKTRFGFHIIKLTEVNEPRQLAFAEVADKIRTTLEESRRKQLYADWLEPLKTSCPVEKFPLQ